MNDIAVYAPGSPAPPELASAVRELIAQLQSESAPASPRVIAFKGWQSRLNETAILNSLVAGEIDIVIANEHEYSLARGKERTVRALRALHGRGDKDNTWLWFDADGVVRS